MNNIEIIKQSFFVVDRNNIMQEMNNLYGYLFGPDKVYANEKVDLSHLLDSAQINDCIGAYVYFYDSTDKISLLCDSLNSFYLFVYKSDDYWCLSNSFWHMLSHLEENHKSFTLNTTYVHQMFSVSMSPLSVAKTLANEVSIVPQFTSIWVDKNSYDLHFEKGVFEFETLDIDSDKGMNLFYSWINKYVSFYHMILKEKYHMRIDLSGGYDSRVSFSFAYAAGLSDDSNNVEVFSIVPKGLGNIEHFSDDIQIATKIAGILDINLNSNGFCGKNVSGKAQYLFFKNAFLGFHNEGYFEPVIFDTPVFHIGGFNGEPVRGKVRSISEWVSMNRVSIDSHDCVFDELINDFIYEKNNSKNEAEFLTRFYLTTWGRNHYGGTIIRDFLIGRYAISPFMDLMPFQLKMPNGFSRDLLFALVICKTCPDILEIPFADGTCFSENTILTAKRLLDKYSDNCQLLYQNTYDYSSIESLDRSSDFVAEYKTGDEYLYSIFSKAVNKAQFINENNIDGKKRWEEADTLFKNKDVRLFNKKVVPAVAVQEFIHIRNACNAKIYKELCLTDCDNDKLKKLYYKKLYNKVCRTDLKIYGDKKNHVCVEDCNDKLVSVSSPKWFSDADGIGTIVESNSSNLTYRIRCYGNGKLKIVLRSKDIRDENRHIIPAYIRYKSLFVNGINVLMNEKDVSHDTPFLYELVVDDGEMVAVSLDWEEVE